MNTTSADIPRYATALFHRVQFGFQGRFEALRGIAIDTRLVIVMIVCLVAELWTTSGTVVDVPTGTTG